MMTLVRGGRIRDDLILVDGGDCEVGFCEKVACHVGQGKLHRAFSIHIFNSRGELLIHRRAEEKLLWGGFWSNSCCSHPRRGEDLEDAAARRIVEELGIACSLRRIYKFRYAEEFEDVGWEREVCSVFVGRCDDEPVADPDEISEVRWIGVLELLEDVEVYPEKYTPWFKMELMELRRRNLL